MDSLTRADRKEIKERVEARRPLSLPLARWLWEAFLQLERDAAEQRDKIQRYDDMQTRYEQLVSDYNALVAVFTAFGIEAYGRVEGDEERVVWRATAGERETGGYSTVAEAYAAALRLLMKETRSRQ